MPLPRSPTPSMQTRPQAPPISLTRRYLVFGRVQGVYFRHSTRSHALGLGLRGVVRNLPDGSVEVLAQGTPSSVEALHQWLHRGPELARVDVVREADLFEAAELQIPPGFEVL
jgi:acylphosphatase